MNYIRDGNYPNWTIFLGANSLDLIIYVFYFADPKLNPKNKSILVLSPQFYQHSKSHSGKEALGSERTFKGN